MQQTDKYKLNLIETSDAFSPNPLNENMEKVEGALTAVTAHADAGDAALDARVTVLESRHAVGGSYRGDGNAKQTVDLGFAPALVLTRDTNGTIHFITSKEPSNQMLLDNGFQVSGALNMKNFYFYFIALT